MDFRDSVIEALDKTISTGKLQGFIENAISKTVNDIGKSNAARPRNKHKTEGFADGT